MKKLTFNNTNMYLIPSEKFKTFSVALKFFVPLKEETAGLNGVFPFVLKSGSKNYPDMIAIAKALESYYGGVFDVGVRKKGDLQEIDFYFEFLSPKFADDSQIDNCILFIKEVLLNPKKEGNGFSKEFTEVEKSNLIDYIDGIINDKKEYTAVRLIEEMFKGEPFSIFESGTKESVMKINPENLFNQYEKVIKNAHLEIFISGNADLERIADGLKDFALEKRDEIPATTLYNKDNEKPNVIEEKVDTVQGKFGLGFKTNIPSDSKDYFKLTLFNSVFGSGPTSKLFMNVREKLSLCYYVYSRLDRLKGIMTVFTGCDREKFKTAYDEIFNQLSLCQSGNIEDEEISNAKSFLTTVLKQTSDSQRSLNEFYMTGILSGNLITPEEYIEEINSTTKEDIVRLAKNIKLEDRVLSWIGENMEFKKIYNEKLDESVYHGITESGLNVFVFPKAGFSKKYAVYAVNFGSCDISYTVDGKEYTDPLGVAHFLEHKLFELPNGKNAFDLFAKTGASANAFTSHNMTAYLFSAADNFNESLEILLSYVNDPYFTDENVEKEQGIIAQEIKMYDDDPEWRLFNAALSCLYENNPVKDDIAGSVESISHITKEVLYNTYDAFYRPENMVLFVIGDVSEKDVGELAEKYAKKRDKKEVIRKTYTEKDEVYKKNFEKEMSISNDNFILSFKDNSPSLSGEEQLIKSIETTLALKMMFGKSSAIYNELYMGGYINDTFSYDTLNGEGYSAIMIGSEAKDVKKTSDKILEGIKKVKETGFTDEDFSRAKNAVLGREVMAFNSIEAVGNSFCSNFFSGIGVFDFIDAFKKVTKESVHKRVFEILGDNYSLSVIRSKHE